MSATSCGTFACVSALLFTVTSGSLFAIFLSIGVDSFLFTISLSIGDNSPLSVISLFICVGSLFSTIFPSVSTSGTLFVVFLSISTSGILFAMFLLVGTNDLLSTISGGMSLSIGSPPLSLPDTLSCTPCYFVLCSPTPPSLPTSISQCCITLLTYSATLLITCKKSFNQMIIATRPFASM